MNKVIDWFNPTILTFAYSLDDTDGPLAVAGLSGINYIYEGVTETGLCSFTAGEGVLDIKNKNCYRAGGPDTLSVSFPPGSDGLLIGETIKAYKVVLDFDVDNMSDSTTGARCWLGINRYEVATAPRDAAVVAPAVPGVPYDLTALTAF